MVFAGEHGRGLPARSRQGLAPAACDQQGPTEVSPLLEPELRSCWSQGIPVQAPGEQELGDIPWGALGPSRAIPHLRLAPGCPWQDRAAGSIHTAAFPESVPASSPCASLSPAVPGRTAQVWRVQTSAAMNPVHGSLPQQAIMAPSIGVNTGAFDT